MRMTRDAATQKLRDLFAHRLREIRRMPRGLTRTMGMTIWRDQRQSLDFYYAMALRDIEPGEIIIYGENAARLN